MLAERLRSEEVPQGGSIGMIKAGCLDGIDNVFGIHVMSNMEVGTVGIHPGSVHTGRATFKVKGDMVQHLKMRMIPSLLALNLLMRYKQSSAVV